MQLRHHVPAKKYGGAQQTILIYSHFLDGVRVHETAEIEERDTLSTSVGQYSLDLGTADGGELNRKATGTFVESDKGRGQDRNGNGCQKDGAGEQHDEM